ncbi:hypothetical protein IG631_13521 [Alternaria alternata]|nr:hypothetical protein IG631_13521 [Alternaria alternata]
MGSACCDAGGKLGRLARTGVACRGRCGLKSTRADPVTAATETGRGTWMHLGSTHVSHASRQALQDRGGGSITCTPIRHQVYLIARDGSERGWAQVRRRWSAVVRRSSARVPEYKRQPRMTQPKRHAAKCQQVAPSPAGDGRDGVGSVVAIGQR